MKALAPLLTFALIASKLGAEPLGSAMVERLKQDTVELCGDDAEALFSELPNVFDSVATEWDGRDPSAWTYNPREASTEFVQIIAYTMLQAEQVSYVIAYTADLDEAYAEGRQPNPTIFRRASVLTNLTACLHPTGVRFSYSSEEGISELAAVVTQASNCAQFQRYSDNVLALDFDSLNRETYRAALEKIGNETIGLCGGIASKS